MTLYKLQMLVYRLKFSLNKIHSNINWKFKINQFKSPFKSKQFKPIVKLKRKLTMGNLQFKFNIVVKIKEYNRKFN